MKKLAWEFDSYKDYCSQRISQGHTQVIPEDLWEELREEYIEEIELSEEVELHEEYDRYAELIFAEDDDDDEDCYDLCIH